MKLSAELPTVVDAYQTKRQDIAQYAVALKQAGGYQDYETRLAWDVLRAVMGTTWICSLYEKYDCHDPQIETLAKKALRTVVDLD